MALDVIVMAAKVIGRPTFIRIETVLEPTTIRRIKNKIPAIQSL